jgi:hypothetical protein
MGKNQYQNNSESLLTQITIRRIQYKYVQNKGYSIS